MSVAINGDTGIGVDSDLLGWPALEIVEIAKADKVFLAVAQVAKLPVQQLDRERAMEALVLALGLRIPHPQAQPIR